MGAYYGKDETASVLSYLKNIASSLKLTPLTWYMRGIYSEQRVSRQRRLSDCSSVASERWQTGSRDEGGEWCCKYFRFQGRYWMGRSGDMVGESVGLGRNLRTSLCAQAALVHIRCGFLTGLDSTRHR